jgi:hypothetical protein
MTFFLENMASTDNKTVVDYTGKLKNYTDEIQSTNRFLEEIDDG